MNKLLGPLLIILILFSACQKKVTNNTTSTAEKLDLQFIDYNYFSSKSKLEYKDNATDIKATVTIRAKKDSVIWLNVTKSGFAGVRILVNRDSVSIIDNINKEFMVMTYGDLQERYALNVDFNLFQSTMLSNLLYPNAEQDVKKEGAGWVMHQIVDDLIIENHVKANGQNLKSVLIKQEGSDNLMTLKYSEYEDIGGYQLPKEYRLKMNYKSGSERLDTDVDIKHYRAEFLEKPLTFPFKIPAKYVRI